MTPTTVEMDDVPSRWAELVPLIKAGAEIILTEGAVPQARLTSTRPAKRPFGLARGEFTVPDDFDAPLPNDVLQPFLDP